MFMQGETASNSDPPPYSPPSNPALLLSKNDTPIPGGIYIISETTSSNVITYTGNGDVNLMPFTGEICGTQKWICRRSNDWLGFYNQSGLENRYLGHNGIQEIVCRAKRHQLWEYMEVRKREGEGFDILVENWFGTLPMGFINRDGQNYLGRTVYTNTWWGFTKVG